MNQKILINAVILLTCILLAIGCFISGVFSLKDEELVTVSMMFFTTGGLFTGIIITSFEKFLNIESEKVQSVAQTIYRSPNTQGELTQEELQSELDNL